MPLKSVQSSLGQFLSGTPTKEYLSTAVETCNIYFLKMHFSFTFYHKLSKRKKAYPDFLRNNMKVVILPSIKVGKQQLYYPRSEIPCLFENLLKQA